jgi:hypothetical protein
MVAPYGKIMRPSGLMGIQGFRRSKNRDLEVVGGKLAFKVSVIHRRTRNEVAHLSTYTLPLRINEGSGPTDSVA